MSMIKEEIVRWFKTLPKGAVIAIDDDGMRLIALEADHEAWLEIGGYTRSLYYVGEEENEFWPVYKRYEDEPGGDGDLIANFTTLALAEMFIEIMEGK